MLETIRSRAQGKLAKIILAAIMLPFAFVGIDAYFGSNPDSDFVASVGEGGVTRANFTTALKSQAEEMRRALGPGFDPAAVETRDFREQVLNSLIDQEALLREAQAAKLTVNDDQLALLLHRAPEFQQDGKFSPELFNRFAINRGYRPEVFKEELRRSLQLQFYAQPLAAASFVSTTSASQVAAIAGQRREISRLEIAPSVQAAAISDADLQAYYNSHQKDYMEAEAVRVEYLVLSADALAASLTPTEQQIQDYYKANASKLGPPEQRSASHILIQATADAAARKQAKAKAESLLAAVTKAPKSFADVAKKESQDPGSAKQGGNLGGFGRGAMVKPFDDAVFSMKPGELRLVETEYGFHVIRLDGIQSSIPPLATVRSVIEAEVRKQMAQKQFAGSAEMFGNLVYEKPESLKPAADAMKLRLETSDWMTRKGLPVEPLNNAKLLEVVFAADSIKSRQSIEALEIGKNVMVAARVIEHRPAAQKPLAGVADSIRSKLATERAAEAARKQGEARIAELRLGKEASGNNWSAFEMVGRQAPGALDAATLREVMRADASKLPVYVGAAIPGGGYRIVRVSRVMSDAAANPMLVSAVQNGIRQAYVRADQSALVELSKSSQKVELDPRALEKKE